MINPQVVEAVRACLGEAYLVGGAVRDSYIGVGDGIDYDIATPLTPQEAKAKLEESGFKVTDYSARYGTITTQIAGSKIEITTYRTEIYQRDSRFPQVSFSTSLDDDLSRRDFTINAIATDGAKVYDPFGGIEDIRNKKIRAVGNPSERFREDPLRILRALRFVSTLGFTLESNTLDAVYDCSPSASALTGERISSELNKILEGQNWIRALSIGLEAKIFEPIFGVNGTEPLLTDFIEALSINNDKYHPDGLLTRWTIVLLAANSTGDKYFEGSRVGLLNYCFSMLRERLKWSNEFSRELYESVRSELQKRSLSVLEEEYRKLEVQGDSRRVIVEEKILKVKLQSAFSERNFSQVEQLAKQILAMQNNALKARTQQASDRAIVVRDIKPHMLKILKYLCAAYLAKLPYVETAEELNTVVGDLIHRKEIFESVNLSTSDQERAQIVEDGLIMVSRMMPGRVTNLTVPDIQYANHFILQDHKRLTEIENAYIHQLFTLRTPPLPPGRQNELAQLNEKIASILLQINNGQQTSRYYSRIAESYKWKALLAKTKKGFWDSFERMNAAFDDQDQLEEGSEAQIRDNASVGQYVDTAQCLAHLLSIEKNLDKKIEIAFSVMASYQMAGRGFARHVPRYRLLREWLILARDLLGGDEKTARKVLKGMPLMSSYHYVDPDEDYVTQYLPEFVAIRDSLLEIEAYLSAIFKQTPFTISKHEELGAAVTLMKGKLIDRSLSLEILKKVVAAQVDADISIEPLSLLSISGSLNGLTMGEATENANLALIGKGESETVEFKASWRYDIEKNEVDSSRGIKQSVLKAVVSFMNTMGGTVFIGVNDDGTIRGLENADFLLHRKKNFSQLQLQDTIKKDIDNSLAQAIGEADASLLKEVTFDTIEGRTVAIIKVKASREPIFLNEQLYIRSSASSPELTGRELYKFIVSRSRA